MAEINLDGSNQTDLKNVYDLIGKAVYLLIVYLGTQRLVEILCALAVLAWREAKRWNKERRERPIPYRVIKPPSNVVTETEGGEKKRIVAVLGGTGFVGSHVVEELLSREECHVYLLGRRFGSVSEEVRSRVAALIQVDMMDYDGLVKAFQGVDSVIHTAATVPKILFTTIVWVVLRNCELGIKNILAAAQTSGVKQLVFVMPKTPQSPRLQPIVIRLIQFLLRSNVVCANGKEGLSTCVLEYGQIYGINNYCKMFLRSRMSHFPLRNVCVTLQPVEYTTRAILAAEKKLMERSDNDVTGKVLRISGWPTTEAEFFSIPEWGHSPPRNMSLCFVSLLAKLNDFVAKVTRWAPMGVYMVEFNKNEDDIFAPMDELKDDSIVQEAL